MEVSNMNILDIYTIVHFFSEWFCLSSYSGSSIVAQQLKPLSVKLASRWALVQSQRLYFQFSFLFIHPKKHRKISQVAWAPDTHMGDQAASFVPS